jgi:hypothetical protein
MKADWKLLTAFVLAGTVVVLVVYDVLAEVYGGDRTTISRVVYNFARAEPVAAFALGVLVGHLFWPQAKGRQDGPSPRVVDVPPLTLTLTDPGEGLLRAADARPAGPAVEVTYTNWKGERRLRKIAPVELWWGATPWHPTPQYLLKAVDLEGGLTKDFAMSGFEAWGREGGRAS